MTDQELNIAIAKERGYISSSMGMPGDSPYTTDLNAMHEVENGMNEDEKEAYIQCLVCVCLQVNQLGIPATLIGMFIVTNATARQRAEAYARMKGIWHTK